MTNKIKRIAIEEEGDIAESGIQYNNIDARLQSSIDVADYLVQSNASSNVFKEEYFGYGNQGTGTTITNRLGYKPEYLININGLKNIVVNNFSTIYDIAVVLHATKSTSTLVFDSGWINAARIINVSNYPTAHYAAIRVKYKSNDDIDLNEISNITNVSLYFVSNINDEDVNIEKLQAIIEENMNPLIESLKTDVNGKEYETPEEALKTSIKSIEEGESELGIYFSKIMSWKTSSSATYKMADYPINFEANKNYKIIVQTLPESEINLYNVYLMKDRTMNSASQIKTLSNNIAFTLTSEQVEQIKYIQIRSQSAVTEKGLFKIIIKTDNFIERQEIDTIEEKLDIIGDKKVGAGFEEIDVFDNKTFQVWDISNGKLVLSNFSYYITTYKNVSVGEKYIIKSYYGANQKKSYVFAVDDEMNIIEQYCANPNGLLGEFMSDVITIPDGATRLYVGQFTGNYVIKIWKIEEEKYYGDQINQNTLRLQELNFVDELKDLHIEPKQQSEILWSATSSVSWKQSFLEINWDITKNGYLYFSEIPDKNIKFNIVYGLEKNINSSNIKKKFLEGQSITERYLKIPGWEYEGEGIISWMAIYANTDIAYSSSCSYFQESLFYEIGDIKEEIKELNIDIGMLQKNPESILPDYYFENNYLYNKIDEVRENILNSENSISFAFATDLHFPSNTGYSKYMIKAILDSTLVPFALFGGDYPGAYGNKEDVDTTAKQWLNYIDYIGKDKAFSVQGNHDWTISHNDVEGETGFTGQDSYIYNYLGRTIERYVDGLNYPNIYYYIDIPAQRTRIFMLNSCDTHSQDETQDWGVQYSFGKKQLKWLIEKINEVENYNFVAIAHIPGDSSFGSGWHPSQLPLQNLLIALKNKTSYSETLDGETITADFSSSTNDIACLITGHLHRDVDHVNNNLLNIGVTCDATYNDDQWAPATRGTIKENAFDVFTIDFTNKVIKTVRFGRGENRIWNYV